MMHITNIHKMTLIPHLVDYWYEIDISDAVDTYTLSVEVLTKPEMYAHSPSKVHTYTGLDMDDLIQQAIKELK